MTRLPLCSGKEHIMRGNACRASRVAAYVASGALVISGTILALTPAEAVTHDPIGQTQGATWLDGELTNGLMHNNHFDFDDYGLSADTAFALDAVGGHAVAVTDVGDALAANIDAYTKFGSHVFMGSLAKLAVLADLDTGHRQRHLVRYPQPDHRARRTSLRHGADRRAARGRWLHAR